MKHLFLLFTIIYSFSLTAQNLVVEGGAGTPYIKNINRENIDKIVFLNGLGGATITLTTENTPITFYKYTNSDGDRVVTPHTETGINTYQITDLEDNRGYYVEYGDGMTENVVWIIDYPQHLPWFSSITPVESGDECNNLKLLINKSDPLQYKIKSGLSRDIERKYTLTYETQKWDDNKNVMDFVDDPKSVDITNDIEKVVTAPLKNTRFTLSGDDIAKHFNIEKSISSDMYEAIATDVRIEMVVDTITSSGNIIGVSGYSSPVEIQFYGHASEAVQYYEWKIFNKKDLLNYIVRYTDRDISYTFDAEGDYLVTLNVANGNPENPCETTNSAEFSVSETQMLIPNFFSPDSSPGVNDEFKVAYRSITDFKCTIFNRWGNKLYEWKDPSQGWDGKYKGKLVSTGVYFYVIEYKDSKGEKHTRAGDINILRSK